MSLTRCDRVAHCDYGCNHDGPCSMDLSPLLERALPMLVDSNRDGSLGERCDLIGDIKDALENR